MATDRPTHSPDRLHYLLFAAGLLAYATLFICLTLTRFYGLGAGILDLGAFDQFFWSILHRGAPLSTVTSTQIERHWFGFHFSPILYLLLPVYCIAPYPETLMVANVLLITSSAIPFYLTTRHLGLPPWQRLAWCAALLCNPFMLNNAIWDFHEVSLAMPAMGFVLYAIIARKKWLLWAMVAILLLCKEHYGLSVAAIGLLWAIQNKDWRGGLAVSAVGLAAFLLIFLVIMPSYNRNIPPELLALGYHERFSWLLNPGSKDAQFFIVLALQNVFYLGVLLLPFWFLPVLAWWWVLPAAGDIAVNMVSATDNMRSLYSYHSAMVIPVLAVAALQAGLALSRKRPALKVHEVTLIVLLANVILGYVSAPIPLPGATNLWEIDLHNLSDPHRGDIDHIRAMLPPERAISVQSNLGAFFSHRAHIYEFPEQTDMADAVVLHLEYPFRHSRSVFGAPFDRLTPKYIASIRELMDDCCWGITYWHDKWLVMERNKPSTVTDIGSIEKTLEQVQADYVSAGKPLKP